MGMIKIGRIRIGWGHAMAMLALVLLLLLPVLMPKNNYLMHFFVLFFIWAVVAEAWNLIMGYAGIFTFGTIAFFTIGAFATGLLSQQLGMSPWPSILLSGILTALVGFLIGLPSLRLKGAYIALITYALHMLLAPLIRRGKPIGIETGGFIWNIASLNFLGYVFPRNVIAPWYYAGLTLFVVLLLLIYWVIRSPIGRAFVALRDAGPLAQSLGVNEYKYKLIVFGLSAFILGVIGAFYAHYVATISDRMLGLDYFVKTLIMVILGGLGTFPGGVVGAFVVIFLYEFMRPLMSYRLIVLGAIVILTVVYMPNGLTGTAEYIIRTKKWKLVGDGFLRRLAKMKKKI